MRLIVRRSREKEKERGRERERKGEREEGRERERERMLQEKMEEPRRKKIARASKHVLYDKSESLEKRDLLPLINAFFFLVAS